MSGPTPTTNPVYIELSVQDPELVLYRTAEALPGATLDFEYQQSASAHGRAFLTVTDAEKANVDEALAEDPTVSDVLFVGEIGNRLVYRFTVVDCVDLVPAAITDVGVHILSLVAVGCAWRVKLHAPSRDALQSLTEHYHGHDISFHLKRLHRAMDTDHGYETYLTPTQRRTLVTAYRGGYFEVPRDITQGELAAELGLSRSGLSQRLRRATGKLVEFLLLR